MASTVEVSSSPKKEMDQIAAHVDDVEANSTDSKQDLSTPVAVVPKRSWRSYIWDSLDKSPAERRLVFKLDCALLTIGCLGYFVKFLDQVNINNAFVSGMKEDLNMYGNQLNYMQTAWGVG
jgi:MFS transporter, ACS family, pantothenate transporter